MELYGTSPKRQEFIAFLKQVSEKASVLSLLCNLGTKEFLKLIVDR